jgi:hypothetical protein
VVLVKVSVEALRWISAMGPADHAVAAQVEFESKI